MARKSFVIDKNDWRELFDGFCDEAYANIRKRIDYQTFRRLKKGPSKEVQITFNDNAVSVYDVDEIGEAWFDMFIGTKDDSSFGSYLFDYFQEVLKPMHEDEKKYDIWGLTSESCKADSCSASVAADKLATVTTWAGDLYYNYADANIAISTAYTTLPDSNRKRIEELERMVQILQDKSATKVDREHFEHDLDAAVEEVYGAVDETRYELTQMYDRIMELEEKQAQMPKFEVQETASSYYPARNYKINLVDLPGCDDNRKEKENMDTNKMFNGFELGPVDDRVKMSPYGMAIRNAEGRYVSYDPKAANIVDVEVFNFDNHNLIYKMPVAVSAIAVGDTVIHMKKPMFVTNVTNGITVIDIFNGEVKTIMPATNMFGFNYLTKVVSLFNFTGDNSPTEENPFGNVLPFMLMNDTNFEDNDMFMFMAMMNGNSMNTMFQNPMMMYILMNKNDSMKEMLPFLLMSGINPMESVTSNKQNCNCNCNHEGHN